MKYLRFLCFFLFASTCQSQVLIYNAPTSVSAIPLPSPIPCPFNGSCSANNGSLTGANWQISGLTDFPNTPIVRVTDNSTFISGHTESTSCDASSEVNIINKLNNRFFTCASGQNQLLFSWNSATLTATKLTFTDGSVYTSSPFFSFTQNYVFYWGYLSGGNDPSIYSYDASAANPSGSLVVDLATTCSIAALQGNSNAFFGEGISVSGDDQTFGALLSSTAGQGSSGAVYVVVWNRTTGCTYWNTNTDHWFINGSDQGLVSGTTDTFTLHNIRLGKGGTWVKVSASSCIGGCSTNGNYFWQVGASTVTLNNGLADGCGHTAAGYTHWVNKCNGNTNVNGLFSATFASPNSQTSLPAAYPSPERAQGAHISWANDNNSDTAPFITIFEDAANFTVTDGWDNEIVAVSTGGSGLVYRLLHTFATPAVSPFVPGAISADGQILLWTSDWNGMVGNTNGSTAACTPGTNCRTDVFLAVLPLTSNPGISTAYPGVTLYPGITKR